MGTIGIAYQLLVVTLHMLDTLSVSGGRQYCECTVSATSVPGPFSLSLDCNISNNEDNHTLHIKGHTQVLYDTHVYTFLQNAFMYCTCTCTCGVYM